ncbi:MAG: hypothetical protein JWO52_3528, partial [Gammaproteobacteria bacterium]|nr:hypothetical protein [Gammaproteobacteria bacterium]
FSPLIGVCVSGCVTQRGQISDISCVTEARRGHGTPGRDRRARCFWYFRFCSCVGLHDLRPSPGTKGLLLDSLGGDGGQYIEVVVQHHTRQSLVGRYLADALDGIEDHAGACCFLDQPKEKTPGDAYGQVGLGDTPGIALSRNLAEGSAGGSPARPAGAARAARRRDARVMVAARRWTA